MNSSFYRMLLAGAAVSIGGLLIAQTATDPFTVERYLTHIATDKPMYRGGEKVYVRGVLLSTDGHAPMAAQGANRTASFEIKGPKGDRVFSGASPIIDSVVGFAWDIPVRPGRRRIHRSHFESLERSPGRTQVRHPRLPGSSSQKPDCFCA